MGVGDEGVVRGYLQPNLPIRCKCGDASMRAAVVFENTEFENPHDHPEVRIINSIGTVRSVDLVCDSCGNARVGVEPSDLSGGAEVPTA
jgi:hypothetical protein